MGASCVTGDVALCEKYAVDGVIPSVVASPASPEQVAEIVRFAKANELAAIPFGHGTKSAIGMTPRRYDLALEITALDQIAYYDPADLTLSVDAGMSLAKLNEALAQQQQFLPLAVPFFEESTVGGAIAAGLSSSLRASYGSARDFLLGAEFVNGAGALTKSGGRVVKNVTGYDLHKLLIGSLGTLAVLTRLNFRTFPLPQRYGQLVANFSSVEAVNEFKSTVAKSPLSPTSFHILSAEAAARVANSTDSPWQTCISFEGDDSVLRRYSSDLAQYAQQCKAEEYFLLEDHAAKTLSTALRELLATAVRSSVLATIFKISALPAFPVDILRLRDLAAQFAIACSLFAQASGPIYFALEPPTVNDETIATLARISSEVFEYAVAHQGQACLLFCPVELKRAVNVWGPAAADAAMMRRVKNAFDPQNVFAPGRFVSGI
jgi:glycolate oxidase FAD binding subunit